MDQDLVAKISEKFVELLRSGLTKHEWNEMQRLNAKETDDFICHSHDHCDANMVMFDAMEECGVTCFVKGEMPDSVVDLWNTVWAHASAALGKKKPLPHPNLKPMSERS